MPSPWVQRPLEIAQKNGKSKETNTLGFLPIFALLPWVLFTCLRNQIWRKKVDSTKINLASNPWFALSLETLACLSELSRFLRPPVLLSLLQSTKGDHPKLWRVLTQANTWLHLYRELGEIRCASIQCMRYRLFWQKYYFLNVGFLFFYPKTSISIKTYITCLDFKALQFRFLKRCWKSIK